jgi:hypothetical protein
MTRLPPPAIAGCVANRHSPEERSGTEKVEQVTPPAEVMRQRREQESTDEQQYYRELYQRNLDNSNSWREGTITRPRPRRPGRKSLHRYGGRRPLRRATAVWHPFPRSA